MLTSELKKLKEYLENDNLLEIENLDKAELLKELQEIDRIECTVSKEDLFEGVVEEDIIGKGIKDVKYKSISPPSDRCPCCGKKL